MKKLKIAVHPLDPLFPNKYIERMVEAIKFAYPDSIVTPFPKTIDFLLSRYDYVWLNWFENLPLKNKLQKVIVNIIKIIVIKILNIKIISTYHNIQPHETTKSIIERFYFWIIFKLSNRIIILSDDSNKFLKDQFGSSIIRKTIYVPHPTYNCVPKRINAPTSTFNVLFFGYLRPYKNIELIFELARIHKEIPFTIAGTPLSEEYKNQLEELSDTIPNLHLIPRFIPSKELDDLIENHSILLLPYDTASSLNSGVVIYAICKKINMIVPEIGTVNQLQNKDKIFFYSYSSKHDHLRQLDKMLTKAKDEYENRNEYFNQRINILHNEVVKNQSPSSLSSQIKKVFR